VAPAGLEPVTNRLLLPFDLLDRLKFRHIDWTGGRLSERQPECGARRARS
jgi:hypothetical protein